MTEHETILSEIKQAVTTVDAGAEVILFGSRARGDFRDDSDWDVLVLTDRHIERGLKKNIWSKVLDVELTHVIGVTTIIKNKNEWANKFSVTPFFKEVEKDGILL